MGLKATAMELKAIPRIPSYLAISKVMPCILVASPNNWPFTSRLLTWCESGVDGREEESV